MIWVLARTFTLALLINVLAVDALGGVAQFIFFLVGMGGLLVILHAWYPPLRARIHRMRGEAHPMWPTEQGLATAPLRVLWSVAFGVFLVLAASWRMLDLLGRHNPALARLLNAVSRYRLGTEEPVDDAERPSAKWMERFCATGDAPVVRTDEMRALVEAIDGWRQKPQRGIVALVAERGAGKKTVLQSIHCLLYTSDAADE